MLTMEVDESLLAKITSFCNAFRDMGTDSHVVDRLTSQCRLPRHLSSAYEPAVLAENIYRWWKSAC